MLKLAMLYDGFAPLAMLVDREDLDVVAPSCASCSRKSDHSPASDSFLLLPSSGKNSVDKAGVLGVLCHGDTGALRLGLDAPGRARPACSRCSKIRVSRCSGVDVVELYHRSSPEVRQ